MNTELYNAVLKGNRNLVQDFVKKSLAEGINASELLNGTMIPAMRAQGERFSRNEVFVPEMLIAARAMQSGLDILEPVLIKSGHKAIGRIAVGTVKGDLHDIGKNLVSIMLKGAGYEVHDLGVNCDVTKYESIAAQGINVIMCSALLTTTMTYMKTVVEHFKSNQNIKIIVGGAPVTKDFADSIGAHGYGQDANDAVKAADRIFGK